MIDIWYDIKKYSSPLLAIAIHDGHYIREEVAPYLYIGEYDRLREEDPNTGYFTGITGNRIIVNTSRFEVDVNRPRESAVYRTPKESWGIKVWKDDVPEHIWNDALKGYDQFYSLLKKIVEELIDVWGYVIVYDIHSYNYRRKGPYYEESLFENPEINVGTGSLDRNLWGALVDYFMIKIQDHNYLGRHLYVDENVKFRGGYLASWIHKNYPAQSCVLAIELKKIFMDEWTGAADIYQMRTLKDALFETIPGVLHRAKHIKKIDSVGYHQFPNLNTLNSKRRYRIKKESNQF